VVFLSVDPYLRELMTAEKGALQEPFKIGKPIYGYGVAKVLVSKSDKFKENSLLSGSNIPWQEYFVSDGKDLKELPEGMSPELALSTCGMPGMTAYFGIHYIADLKEGEVVLVSAAAGAVGAVVGQLAKTKGCHVIGIVGSDEKAKWITEGLGFDHAINYKKQNLFQALKELYSGIDVYWDNVGGEIFDTAIKLMNLHGRVVNCGAISIYNAKEVPTGPRHEFDIVFKRLKLQGLIYFDYLDRQDEAMQALWRLQSEGKLKMQVTVVEGFDHAPNALLGLFSGQNIGKMLVKCV